MNRYESVIIMKPNLTEEEKSNEINTYKNFFEGLSKKPVDVEYLGKKKLAYEVQGNKEGNYAIFKYNANLEEVSEVERKFRVDDNVLKFITVRQEQEEYEDMEDDEMEY